MIIAGLTFAIVLTVIVAIYWAVALAPEYHLQANLRRRLGTLAGRVELRQDLYEILKDTERLSGVSGLNRMLRHVVKPLEPIQRVIDQSGLRITVGTLLLSAGFAGLLMHLIVLKLSHEPMLGLLAGGLGAVLPLGYLRRARARRVRQFEEAFPEAMDMISRALRAGHSLTTALAIVAEELPDPIATEFRLLHERHNYGLPLPAALRQFATEVPLLDARLFVSVVLTQRETGGNLAEVLETLAAVIRDRFRARRQLRALTAHGRFTGVILVAAVPVMAAAMLVLNPQHVKVLLTHPLGIRMLIVAIVLQVIGTLMIRRIIAVKY